MSQVIRYCRERGGCSVGKDSQYQGVTGYDFTEDGYNPYIGYTSYANCQYQDIFCTTSSGSCCDYSACPYDCAGSAGTQVRFTKMAISFFVDSVRCTIEIHIPMRAQAVGSCDLPKDILTWKPSSMTGLNWFGQEYSSIYLLTNHPDTETGFGACNFSNSMPLSSQTCFARILNLTG